MTSWNSSANFLFHRAVVTLLSDFKRLRNQFSKWVLSFLDNQRIAITRRKEYNKSVDIATPFALQQNNVHRQTDIKYIQFPSTFPSDFMTVAIVIPQTLGPKTYKNV